MQSAPFPGITALEGPSHTKVAFILLLLIITIRRSSDELAAFILNPCVHFSGTISDSNKFCSFFSVLCKKKPFYVLISFIDFP